jgi:hypothetical protein
MTDRAITQTPMTRETQNEAVARLMRIHYGIFMANQRFWYDKALIDADRLVCVTASNIRKSEAG